MSERYTKAGETIRDNYTERHYSLDEVPFLLNQLYREAMITKRDVEHSIELKAVNRHLRMENRFLTIKLQQLVFRGMLDIKDIEKELSDLCLNPDEASQYIHKFEKENFELKKKLRELGEYNGDLL
ncbi:hypothetical protein [Methanobrevibacter sp.]|uniref:hypothetical protein n=1 Tax=Methanobrevibacter sp. TaxID=66852 RepID=UPI0025E09ABF|nr:hypothetical protein [Methanobrevibacter sp.]MBQ2832388.1 hypothetical protein [Methanobrevibacter sp.]